MARVLGEWTKNVRDAHAEERKRLDESTEEGAELLAARQSSWA
eukprot:COSAG06_NODE_19173_length_850_cov_1.756325_1_plen_42_part_10